MRTETIDDRWEQAARVTGAAPSGTVGAVVGDSVKIGDWRLIENTFPGKVIALHENGSIRVRLEDGRELDGWPERTKPIPNAHALAEERSDDSQQRVVGNSGGAE